MSEKNVNNLISVIVPVYKVEKFLKKCVESIVNQTYHNLEIILVDDGSPDACPKMCDDFAKKDSRITVIHKKNGGLSDARNYGLDVYKGDYVCFIDSDDYFNDNAIEMYYLSAIMENADIVVGNYKKVVYSNQSLIKEIEVKNYYAGKTIKGESYNNFVKYLFSKDTDKTIGLVSACNKLYKREFIEKNKLRFEYGIHNEDWFFNLKAYSLNPTVTFIDTLIFNYYIDNRANTLSRIRDSDFKWVNFSYEFYKKYYPQIDDGIRLEKSFYNGAINSFYVVENKNISKQEKEEKLNEIIKDDCFKKILQKLGKTYQDFYADEKMYAKNLKKEQIKKKIKGIIKKIIKR